VVCRAHSWTNTGKHNDLALLTGHKGISQDHGKFALTERHVLTLGSLAFLLIERSNALLQGKKRLVDLGTLSLSVFVVALAVLGSLRTCKINEKELTTIFDTLFLDLDLSNGMTSTGCIVGFGCMSCSHLISLLNKIKYLIIIINKLLSQARDLDGAVLILSKRELSVIIQKIVKFSTIYFIHGYGNSKVSLVVLPIVDSSLKEIFDSDALKTVHGISFA
jgi:hypothetical protein